MINGQNYDAFIYFLLVAVLLLFQYDFWFGKNGYLDYKRTAQQIAQHKQENEKLSQRNQVVAAEIKDLKQGVEAIEERARFQHDMVKPDEIFYHIVKEQK
nr:cell division protein FtsB [Pasteurella multocida]